VTRTISLAACLALSAPVVGQPRTDVQGDPLPEGALARFGTVRFRTGWSDPYLTVPDWALSPDGKTLALDGIGEGLTLWDIESGRAIFRVPPAESAVLSVAFSPDGKHLVRVERGKVSLFDAATGRERRAWDLTGPVVASFLPGTSRFVVTVRGRAYAHVFDAERAVQLPPWDAEAPVLAPTPSGRFFLGESDAGLHLVDTKTGRVRCRFPTGPDPDIVAGATDPSEQLSALSPDDRRLYLVRPTGELLTFDATTGRKLRELDPPPGWPGEGGYRVRLALSPDGSVAYLSKRECPTHRRDLKAGKWLDPLPVMPGGPLIPHPDGKRLLLIGEDGVLRRYDLTTRREIPPPGFDGQPSVAVSPDGRRVAISAGRSASKLAVFDRTGKELWSAPLPAYPRPPRWSADGRLVACATEAEVTVCDAATGRALQTRRAPDGAGEFFGPIGFDLAGNRLVAVLDCGRAVATFSLGPDAQVTVSAIPDGGATDVSPDGRTVACVNGGPTVALFDVPAGRFRVGWSLPAQGRGKSPLGFGPTPNEAWFSQAGAGLFSWAGDGTLLLWDAETGEPQGVIETGLGAISSWARSPDGLWLAAAQGEEVSLWEVPTGKYLATRELPHGYPLTGLAFVGPGRLLTTSTDHTALLWDVAPKKKPAGPLWDALAGDDARAAYQAAWALAADPRGPDILRTRIAPAIPVPAERLNRWLAHLGSDDYRAREMAMRELCDLGRLVEPDLRAALAKAKSEEVRTRLERLLVQVPRMRTGDEWVQARAVLALELAGTGAAKKVLAEWAAGAPGARLTMDAKAALARLAATR
jgi:WD40 repeat protein